MAQLKDLIVNGDAKILGKLSADNMISYEEVVSATVSIAQLSAIVNAIYPVGTVYTSKVNTNPGTLFGGSWTAISTTSPYSWERTA